MPVKVRETQRCRYYDLVMDSATADLHHNLINDFLNRGFLSPRGGSSGPHVDPDTMRVVKGQYRRIFFLNELVCDEYEEKMGIANRAKEARKKRGQA
jgi:hypothetical protein